MNIHVILGPALLAAALVTAPAAAASQAGDPAAARPAAEPISVIATVPAWGALAREIGGDLVDVVVLCRPGQDIHSVTATPSLMGRIRDADLLLYTGLDLEFWLDPMLRSSGNLDLLPGSKRAVKLSDGMALKEVPAIVSRAQGDIHAFGNPHVWTDPVVIRQQAPNVLAALVGALPEHADALRARYDAFQRSFGEALVRWLEDYRSLRGAPVVTYHASWPYLLDRFGMELVGTIEPKPRVAPTASHLQALVETMRARGVKVIVREPWNAPDAAEFVARETGAAIVELATHPGLADGEETLVAYYDRVLAALATALGKAAPDPAEHGAEPGKP